MITFKGVEYHVVPAPKNNCTLVNGTMCCFNAVNCTLAREQYPCTKPSVIFLTRAEYLAHIARKLTS